MSKLLRGFWLPIVLLTSLLTACGGGGGGDDTVAGGSTGTAVTTGITSGIAVDPYITGAKFEEIGADGLTIQSSTGNSSNTGGFSFSDAIQDGSIIQIDLAAKGMHAGKNFQGIIKRQVFVGDQEPVIVSPLTTLLANGMSPASVINTLSSAGLSGLNESDLYADPMAALAGKTGNFTESDLVLLQANMAVNTFMVATGDFSYGGPAAVATSPVSFTEIANIVKESLNPVIYQQLATAIGPDFTLEDMANMAVVICDGAAEQVKSGTPIGSVTIIDNDLANAIAIADGFYQKRTGGTTTPPATGTPDGLAIFAGDTGATCSNCHTVGTGTGIMDLAGDGSKVSGKFANGASHNGNTLTASEITAVASYFDSVGGTTNPGTGTGGSTPSTPDGQKLVNDNCLGCHNIGQGGTMDLSGKGNAAYTNITSGHNGISMTDLEANAVADYLDTLTPPSVPTAPFVHPYFSNPRSAHRNYVNSNGTSNCVSCHGTDLRGSGSAPSCYTCHGKKW
jgi:mono/diheme cytochrome c family protein